MKRELLKKTKEKETIKELFKLGTINVLALGYRGVELWRENRVNLANKQDEKKA